MGYKAKFNRDHSPIPIEGGQDCPLCNKPTQRYKHDPKWYPAPGQGYYKYWDRCRSCNRLWNPVEAYVKWVSKVS